jgi:hypothetical protein
MNKRILTWPMFDRVWRRAALFEQMADLLNIDPGDAARLDRGDAIRAAHQRCLECRHAQDCRNWIGVSEGVPLPPSYCRNTEFFARCNRDASRGVLNQAGA